MDRILKIDPEFRNKIPPLTAAEYKQLEENILSAGEVYEPIAVWNDTIVDGHNRWQVIQENPDASIKYRIREMEFADKWAAFDWMYRNQLGRRNLTEMQRTMLLGLALEARKKSHGADQARKNGRFGRKHQSDANGTEEHKTDLHGYSKTATAIAKETGVSQSKVERAAKFARGIEAIRKVSPETADKILAEKVSVSKESVQRAPHLDENQLRQFVKTVEQGHHIGVGAMEQIAPKPKPRGGGGSAENRRIAALVREHDAQMQGTREIHLTVDDMIQTILLKGEEYVRTITTIRKYQTECFATKEDRKKFVTAIRENFIPTLNRKLEELENETV